MNLYTNLMNLVKESDGNFFFKDFTLDNGNVARIFSYHFAQYNDWLKPDALECRGIMFEIKDGLAIRVLSRPMEKFFNLDENPFTMDLDFSQIDYYMTKADGSLISTYLDGDHLKLKSKASIQSDQAQMALALLEREDYSDLLRVSKHYAQAGYTLNFEYVAPWNKIVLNYDKPQLILLNVRNNVSGEYLDQSIIYSNNVLAKYYVNTTNPPIMDQEKYVRDQKAIVDIEGYVYRMKSGQHFKLKTEWYCSLHRLKEPVLNDKSLFEAIVNCTADDAIAMYADDKEIIKRINLFEDVYYTFMREASNDLKYYYAVNQNEERKTFAIKATEHFKHSNYPFLFGVAMNLYTKRVQADNMIPALNEVFLKNLDAFVVKAKGRQWNYSTN